MNYVNIHGQPVTVDFRAMVRAIHPGACCPARLQTLAGKTNHHHVYEAPDSTYAIAHGPTEAAAWEAAWRVVEAEAEAQARRDDEHDPDEVY